jgi:hypothetical protein
MGDRIQAYEVYLTNQKLLNPIIFDVRSKEKNVKEYCGNKKLFLSTNDQLLTYFSCNGFHRMNVLSRTSLHHKNYIILRNDMI